MTGLARPLALVTGASSGIGASLARELAQHGHDLVLVARRVEPMRSIADACRGDGALCTIIAVDLSQPGAALGLSNDIEQRGLIIDVLINAAGVGANGRFDLSDPLRVNEMLQVNTVALTELTRSLLPGMVARRSGMVLLVASTAAFQPGPQMAVYCASKAYVLSFGEAIAYELRESGVTVTILCPGATNTDFAQVAGATDAALFTGSLLPVMNANDVARIGYQALQARRRVVVTGSVNRVMAIVSRVAPKFLSLPVANWMMSLKR
jgi:short-subunit dehydrogenase